MFVHKRNLVKLTRNLHLKSIMVWIAIVCSGCGSLQTLPPGSEYKLKHNERYEKTYCDSIPRMYSGVSLDVCLAFIGPPAPMQAKYDEHDLGVFYGYLADIALSFIVDTLALPYTTYRQLNYGRLRLKRQDRPDFGIPPQPSPLD
ncbi:MAG: YceK/YidQ family lipoprotein, partial [Desulfobulbales bacterium]|nr:YceK/YidQ family lipoprotein [Desulfobulbales bacterium]